MGSVIVALAVIGFLVLFSYLKFDPPYAEKKLVDVFNMMVLSVCGVLCFIWFLKVRIDWMGTENEKLWQPVAIAGALGIEIVFLGVCFLLRNFWVFRPPRRPGSGGFWF